jgi:protein-disulfide isomerase
VDQGRIGESTWAAQAAECANQQGKFWEYHDKLFQVWAGENVGTYSKPKLKQYAADVKLDAGVFNQCLDSDKTLSVVQADLAEGTRMGVHQTPTFFLNGRSLQLTSLDYGWFSRTFDSSLK